MWWKDSDCGADSLRGTAFEAATYARRGEAGEKFVLRSLFSFQLMTNKTQFCGVAESQHVVGERIQDE